MIGGTQRDDFPEVLCLDVAQILSLQVVKKYHRISSLVQKYLDKIMINMIIFQCLKRYFGIFLLFVKPC